ncbi:hypothetical protein KDK_11040 [Dictyobacter kobayashii]|uniref:Uncharacterized protein n=1 Tax=Dictyobacter kobayashii TaxID=2014872 RepID=A0A402ADY6_9CHLR|nr:hypothetical protein KDK_11040 [Dictyobacter kobayashii]
MRSTPLCTNKKWEKGCDIYHGIPEKYRSDESATISVNNDKKYSTSITEMISYKFMTVNIYTSIYPYFLSRENG